MKKDKSQANESLEWSGHSPATYLVASNVVLCSCQLKSVMGLAWNANLVRQCRSPAGPQSTISTLKEGKQFFLHILHVIVVALEP